MATCPRCKGHLTDAHRCPRGRLSLAAEAGAAALAGGLAGLVAAALFDGHGRAADLDLPAALAGALIATGTHRLVRR